MNVRRLIVLSLVMLALPALAESRTIPDNVTYQPFLMAPFKPGAPTLVVFKDPHCGYCIEALKKTARLKNYNTYVFWAGILGEASERKVDQILDCKSPVSKAVLTSVIARSNNIQCNKSAFQQARRIHQLNDQIVANYDPRYVPAYYFGGQKVHLSQLQKLSHNIEQNITPIQLNWSRYDPLKLGLATHQGLGHAVVFLPKTERRDEIVNALTQNTNFSWYLVETGCNQGQTCSETERLSEELRLLLDIKSEQEAVVVINGLTIAPHRYGEYLRPTLANLLTIQP